MRKLFVFLFLLLLLTNCIGSGKMIKTKYVAQKDGAIDCGVAGTAMLVNHFYPDISYGEIVYTLCFPVFSYFGSLSSQAGWAWNMDYEFLGKLYGLEYKSSSHEGNVTDEQYEKYLNEIKGYIDRGIPVMVGGWDLYYDDFYGPRIKEMGMGPGQTGHNIVVVGYNREYIYYLDPGAVVSGRASKEYKERIAPDQDKEVQMKNIGNVTYRQSYENFKKAVTSKWKLVYFVYEKISEPLPEPERLKLVEQRNRDKFYGKEEVYDLNYSINKVSFPYSKFGFEAFKVLKEDLKEENFSRILFQRKEHSKENFLFSMMGVGSTKYLFYNNVWATEWGSKYLEEIGRIEDAERMKEMSMKFREGEVLFQQIFMDWDKNGLLTKDSKSALTELRRTIDNIESLYREIL
jgi:hypothetical protein